jgi:hypothetical protein
MEDPLEGWETAVKEAAGSRHAVTSVITYGSLLLVTLAAITRLIRSHSSPKTTNPSHPTYYHRISHRFGLTPTFLNDEEEGEEQQQDDITARELKALQQSPEFQAHIQSRGIDLSKALHSEEQLKALRHTHPKRFFLLCRSDALLTYSQNNPSPSTLFINYMLGISTSLLLFILLPLLVVITSSLSPSSITYDDHTNIDHTTQSSNSSSSTSHVPAAILVIALLLPWFTIKNWVQGRPSLAALQSLYYEDLVWGHLAGPFPSILANSIEVVYVVSTLGIGMVISVGLRCWSSRRQSVGEMIAAIRCIQERRIKQKLF